MYQLRQGFRSIFSCTEYYIIGALRAEFAIVEQILGVYVTRTTRDVYNLHMYWRLRTITHIWVLDGAGGGPGLDLPRLGLGR